MTSAPWGLHEAQTKHAAAVVNPSCPDDSCESSYCIWFYLKKKWQVAEHGIQCFKLCLTKDGTGLFSTPCQDSCPSSQKVGEKLMQRWMEKNVLRSRKFVWNFRHTYVPWNITLSDFLVAAFLGGVGLYSLVLRKHCFLSQTNMTMTAFADPENQNEGQCIFFTCIYRLTYL